MGQTFTKFCFDSVPYRDQHDLLILKYIASNFGSEILDLFQMISSTLGLPPSRPPSVLYPTTNVILSSLEMHEREGMPSYEELLQFWKVNARPMRCNSIHCESQVRVLNKLAQQSWGKLCPKGDTG